MKWLSTKEYYKSLYLGSYTPYTHENYQNTHKFKEGFKWSFFFAWVGIIFIRKISCFEVSVANWKWPRLTLQVNFKSILKREKYFFTGLNLFISAWRSIKAITLTAMDWCAAMFDAVERSMLQESFLGDECINTKSFLSNSSMMDYMYY